VDGSDIARETRDYYDRRAEEYDRTLGLNEQQEAESGQVDVILASLQAGRILEVGCGTGRATRHLKGWVVGVDSSERMLAVAHRRVPTAAFVQAIVPSLPFAASSFDLILAAHLFSHLEPQVRSAFVTEARRVARKLMIVEIHGGEGLGTDGLVERRLTDGSRFRIRKSSFTPQGLIDEAGGGTIVFDGAWFVVVTIEF
jgi:ubiquinone/menaquinone biosynthesis C-methylase UbiE